MTTKTEVTPTSEVTARGEEWYKKLAPELEKEHWGELVAIRIDTGEYIIHPDMYTIGEEFRKKFGDMPGFIQGIGQPIKLFEG